MKHSLFSELKTGTAGQWLFLFGGGLFQDMKSATTIK